MEVDTTFILDIAKALVDFPEQVQVVKKIDEMGVLLELHVDKRDMGKVIGKEGRTVNAMRTLLKALGMRIHAKLNLKIYDPDGESNTHSSSETKEQVSADPTEVSDLV